MAAMGWRNFRLLQRVIRPQGAPRTPFSLKAGLSKEAFITTGVASAVIVDVARLIVYGSGFLADHFAQSADLMPPIAVAVTTAFAGAFLGKRILGKITYRTVQITVAIAMLLIGIGLMAGAFEVQVYSGITVFPTTPPVSRRNTVKPAGSGAIAGDQARLINRTSD